MEAGPRLRRHGEIRHGVQGIRAGAATRSSVTRRYQNRRNAGRVLATLLGAYAGRDEVIVLGLPRGGVPVAFEVASALAAPLDVLLVRKLGVPGFVELAMGAIASGGVRFLNDDVIRANHVPPAAIEAVTASEWRELERREQCYRGSRPEPDLAGRTVILVDDGLATGATMRTAIAAVRARAAAQIVAAVPVGAPETCEMIGQVADEVVCAVTPEPFDAVGLLYEDFRATSDHEVIALLRTARHVHSSTG